MSMRSLESAICWELREVTGVRSIRVKDIMEWSNGPLKIVEGEVQFHLPILGVNASVMREVLGKKWKPKFVSATQETTVAPAGSPAAPESPKDNSGN